MVASNQPVEEVFDSETDVYAVPVVIEDDRTSPIASASDRLVCVVGAELGRRFQVERDPLVIGRGEVDIDLQLHDVSRRHAMVSRDGIVVVIEDLGSANGTFVNGSQIQGKVRLGPGDRIQIGSTIFVVSRHDELEERLAQLKKLDAMNAMVKGLAHDFNNVLMVVLAGLEELGERLPDDASRQVLDDMNRATVSASGLVRRLMRIGRNKPSTLELVPFDALVNETVAIARRLDMYGIKVVVDVAPEAIVRGSREELRQVFLNLILNARDAMPDGGQLLIRGVIKPFDRAAALARHLEHDGQYVEITISDTGVGMDEATLARIFEPFFTTKPVGKGNGLGLAMIYSSIRNHQGAVFAESVVGEGTTFRLLLPLSG